MMKKQFLPIFIICSVLLFSYSLVQENTAPKIRIISPDKKKKLPLNTLVPYAIEISDKEDGSSEYDEIDGNKVILTLAYFPDSLNIKKKKKEAIAKSKILPFIQSVNCFTCHKIKGNLIGPSFEEIAVRYNPTEEDKTYLSQKISRGSQGVWSDEIMPAQPDLKVEEIMQILDWIFVNAQDPDFTFYTGIEGAFKTKEPEKNAIGKAVYVLHAQYTDNGDNESGEKSKKGEHTVVLNIE